MKVETYEAISIDEQSGALVNEEVSEEALALIETLDLGGQRALIQKRVVDGEEVQVRIPYRVITMEELAVFGTLMPHREKLEDYDGGPIPLRALQVAAHAKSCGYFKTLEVWSPEPGRDDPVLVGHAPNRDRTWQNDVFLLARWGEELQSLDELRDKANAILSARVKSAISRAKSEISTLEATLADRVDGFLHGEVESPIYVSISFAR